MYNAMTPPDQSDAAQYSYQEFLKLTEELALKEQELEQLRADLQALTDIVAGLVP